MLIDLAHATIPMVEDVLALMDRPVIVSHTGVKGICDNNRNLSDEYLRKIARNGGLIGIEHVGIGSDLDGSVRVPFDTSRLALLTAALLQQGFTAQEIGQIMGGNFYHFLKNSLPVC